MFTRKKIDAIYRGEIIGKEIIFLESATSTNDVAMSIGRQRKDPEGIVVIAEEQSQGRGRLGREWISPPGVNLYFTVLLRPPFPPREAPVFTLAAAASVVSAIRDYAGIRAGIKWPNDILIGKKKAGGILLEMKAHEGKIELLLIGIGLNVNMPLSGFPDDLRPLSTSLGIEGGKPIDRAGLLCRILEEMEASYNILLTGDKRTLINQWLRLNFTIGNKVKVQNQDRVITGIAENINDRGELLLKLPDGTIETLNSGDVTILKNS
ncbi:MAG: biotin--[acetyl-CoA-carboxylase] ligase [Nitrospiraceae bacterium]|nr:MAG: biotin--[acetyl-CoA-carboxylase] ligase [Nitrospiraceae bacterium]